MKIRRTSYYDGVIQTIDNVLKRSEVELINSELPDLGYIVGEKDTPTTPPVGMVADYSKSLGFDLLSKVAEKFECLKGLKLQRSYVNLFSPAQNAYYHQDDSKWTLMYYPNLEWQINDGGETKFILDNATTKMPGITFEETDNMPVILGIAPIPNRLVLFAGDIPHSATGFRNGNRYTCVLKYGE